MEFDFKKELAKAVAAFYPPPLLAQIRADYAAMPAPDLKPVEHYDELAARRLARLAELDNEPARPE